MRKALMAGGVLLAFAALPALAQQTSTTKPDERWYIGGGASQTEFDRACLGGFSCDTKDDGYKVWVGKKFREWMGGEISYVDLGKAQIAGGETEARGFNFSLFAGVALGENSGLHARVGAMYGEARASASPVAAALGYPTGTQKSWEPSVGVGGTLGLGRNWQLRLDADRYKFEFPGGGKDTVDAVTLGAQYRF